MVKVGKITNHTWDEHYALGNNYYLSKYFAFPNFEAVGALISKNGTLGSATLIAPNLAITAAHILRIVMMILIPCSIGSLWFHDYEVAPLHFVMVSKKYYSLLD